MYDDLVIMLILMSIVLICLKITVVIKCGIYIFSNNINSFQLAKLYEGLLVLFSQLLDMALDPMEPF